MKILVIRFCEIGDVVMTSTLCNSLKKTFPQAQVDYLVHEINQQLYVDHPFIDEVIPLSKKERKNPYYFLKKLIFIKRRQYDIVIDATSTEKSQLFCLFSRTAKLRVGREKNKRTFGYTHKVIEKLPGLDKIEQRMRLLQPFEESGTKIVYDSTMVLNVSQAERMTMGEVMAEAGVDMQQPKFIFSVTAKYLEKRWSTQELAKVAFHCINNHNAQVILYSGSDREQSDIESFHELMSWNANVFSNVSAPSLRNLASLIANADMFIGNEGGPRHISQALDIPSVAIYSPTFDRAEWHPGASTRYRSIAWDDVVEGIAWDEVEFKTGDDKYWELYQRITAEAVIPLVDAVVREHVLTSDLN